MNQVGVSPSSNLAQHDSNSLSEDDFAALLLGGPDSVCINISTIWSLSFAEVNLISGLIVWLYLHSASVAKTLESEHSKYCYTQCGSTSHSVP